MGRCVYCTNPVYRAMAPTLQARIRNGEHPAQLGQEYGISMYIATHLAIPELRCG